MPVKFLTHEVCLVSIPLWHEIDMSQFLQKQLQKWDKEGRMQNPTVTQISRAWARLPRVDSPCGSGPGPALARVPSSAPVGQCRAELHAWVSRSEPRLESPLCTQARYRRAEGGGNGMKRVQMQHGTPGEMGTHSSEESS